MIHIYSFQRTYSVKFFFIVDLAFVRHILDKKHGTGEARLIFMEIRQSNRINVSLDTT